MLYIFVMHSINILIFSLYRYFPKRSNVALFGKTASQWRKENPKADGNIRDCATLEQLVVLSNMESINALLIRQNMPSQERIKQLNSVAILQMKSLLGNQNIKLLKKGI